MVSNKPTAILIGEPKRTLKITASNPIRTATQIILERMSKTRKRTHSETESPTDSKRYNNLPSCSTCESATEPETQKDHCVNHKSDKLCENNTYCSTCNLYKYTKNHLKRIVSALHKIHKDEPIDYRIISSDSDSDTENTIPKKQCTI